MITASFVILVLMSCTIDSQPVLSGYYPFSYNYGQQPVQAVQQPQYQTVQATYDYANALPYSSVPTQPQPVSAQQPIAHSSPAAVVNGYRADGTYAFGYQTPDGQMRTESVQADGTTTGSYAYRTPDGQVITINYSAGRNGFQASPAVPLSPNAAQTGYVDPGNAIHTVQQPLTYQQTQPQELVVLPSVIPQSGIQIPAYYPFNQPIVTQHQQPLTYQTSPSAAAAPTTADQTTGQQNLFDTANIDQHQTQSHQLALARAPSTPAGGAAYGTPVGFSYGSNPQAIQQLQRLLVLP